MGEGWMETYSPLDLHHLHPAHEVQMCERTMTTQRWMITRRPQTPALGLERQDQAVPSEGFLEDVTSQPKWKGSVGVGHV